MSGDRWLEVVTEEARREAEDPFADPRWDRLADGTITPQDKADLERLAAVPGPYQEAMRAFAPLSSEVKNEVARKIQGAEVLPMRRRLVAAVVGLAAAAALAIALVPSDQPLPAYAMDLSGGMQAVRGSPDATALPRFAPDTRFELVARPAARADGPIAAAGVWVGNGVRVRWTPAFERSDDGALRIRGTTRALLPLGPGQWTMMLAIGRPEAVEKAASALALGDPATGDVSLLTTRLEVVAP